MNARSLVLSLLAIPLVLQAQKEVAVESKIRDVTVYQQGAEIIRQASAMVPKGESRLIFTGLTDQLDPRSIQIDARGEYTIISVSWRYDVIQSEGREKSIVSLEGEANKIKREMRLNDARMEALKNEKQMLLSNQSIGGQTDGVNISELRVAADFFRSRLTEIDSLVLGLTYNNENLRKRIGQLNMELSKIAPSDEGTFCEVMLDVRSEALVKGNFLIRYLVNDASWMPEYDLRVLSTSKPIQLDFRAKISQSSGENWEMANISLSTGNPTVSHLKPEMSPWYLRAGSGFHQPISPSYAAGRPAIQSTGFREVTGIVTDAGTGEPLPFATVVIQGSDNTGTVTDMNGRFRLPGVPPDATSLIVSYVGYQQLSLPIANNNMNIKLHESGAALSQVVISKDEGFSLLNRIPARTSKPAQSITIQTNQRKQLSTMTYVIDEAFTVPSNGKEYTLPVDKYSMEAKYRFSSVPRLDCDAFLMAEIVGWEEYNLLSANLNLYLEGKYVGQSYLNTDQTGDELEVSLGRDAGIIVDREKLRDYSSRQLIGGMKKTAMTWKITVKNSKDHAVRIRLEDQIPVSKDEKVDVSLEEASGASINIDYGYLEWDLEMEAGESKEITVKYTVKYPRNYSVKVY